MEIESAFAVLTPFRTQCSADEFGISHEFRNHYHSIDAQPVRTELSRPGRRAASVASATLFWSAIRAWVRILILHGHFPVCPSPKNDLEIVVMRFSNSADNGGSTH